MFLKFFPTMRLWQNRPWEGWGRHRSLPKHADSRSLSSFLGSRMPYRDLRRPADAEFAGASSFVAM